MKNNNGSNSRKNIWIKLITGLLKFVLFFFILFIVIKLIEWIFGLLLSLASIVIGWIINGIIGIIGMLFIFDLIKSILFPKNTTSSRNTTYTSPTVFHNIGKASKPHDHIYSQRVSDGHGGYTWADTNARTGETKDQYGHSGYVRNGEFHDSSW